MARILIGGGSGLIGLRLSRLLAEKGHEVTHLSRRQETTAGFKSYRWDTKEGFLDPAAIHLADYVINLAGAGIGDKRWTSRRKRLIIDSRVDTTRLLLRSFRETGKSPKAFIASAAIGFYGDRGDVIVGEESGRGKGFLSESCVAWENAIDEVARSGIRTVTLRAGIVLSSQGGALPKMIFPQHFLSAPYFGNGRQWYSWIHIDDICRCFIFAIEQENMEGKYNAVAPDPVRNKELMRQLIRVTGRPAFLMPVPAFSLRLFLGEMADTVLDSTRVSSQKLEESGFRFQFPELAAALRDVLSRGV